MGGFGKWSSRQVRSHCAALFASDFLDCLGKICGRVETNQTMGCSPTRHVHRHSTPCTSTYTWPRPSPTYRCPVSWHRRSGYRILQPCDTASRSIAQAFSEASQKILDNRTHSGFVPPATHRLPKFFRPSWPVQQWPKLDQSWTRPLRPPTESEVVCPIPHQPLENMFIHTRNPAT
jgi:hypothetical protein